MNIMKLDDALLKDFVERLNSLEDIRRGEGQRHDHSFVLLLVMLATMSGYNGYRAIGDFIEKHSEELIEMFKPKKLRLPSFSTVRRVLIALNPVSFNSIYKDWLVEVKKAKEALATSSSEVEKSGDGDWRAVDGKAIRGANSMGGDAYTHLVSIFSSYEKVVTDSAKVATKSNEIPCVQKMIQDSDLQGVIFTLDALHCQKKRQRPS